MAVVYKQTELKEGTPLQFLGVYATRWEPEWGEPTVGFREVDYRLDDALEEFAAIPLADPSARQRIKLILHKLVGET